ALGRRRVLGQQARSAARRPKRIRGAVPSTVFPAALNAQRSEMSGRIAALGSDGRRSTSLRFGDSVAAHAADPNSLSSQARRDVDRLDRTLAERLTKLEGQVAQMGTRAPAAAPSQGPDPNKVYTLRLAADAPVAGPTAAPVTIVEFSDFQ